MPVVSGNVFLYNETVEEKEIRNMYPTPILMAVGAIEGRRFLTHKFEEEGSLVFLIGDLKRSWGLGGSEYLKVVHGIVAGDVPVVDLKKEKLLHETLIKLIVVSVEKDKEELLKNHVESVGLDWLLLGKVKGEPELIVKLYEEPILKENVEDLEKLWRDSLANML